MKKVEFTSAAEYARTGQEYVVLTDEEAAKTCYFGMGPSICFTCTANTEDGCRYYAEIDELDEDNSTEKTLDKK